MKTEPKSLPLLKQMNWIKSTVHLLVQTVPRAPVLILLREIFPFRHSKVHILLRKILPFRLSQRYHRRYWANEPDKSTVHSPIWHLLRYKSTHPTKSNTSFQTIPSCPRTSITEANEVDKLTVHSLVRTVLGTLPYWVKYILSDKGTLVHILLKQMNRINLQFNWPFKLS